MSIPVKNIGSGASFLVEHAAGAVSKLWLKAISSNPTSDVEIHVDPNNPDASSQVDVYFGADSAVLHAGRTPAEALTLTPTGPTYNGAAFATMADIPDLGILYRDTQIAHAAILTLMGSPVTLVPDPGANLAILVHRIYAVGDTAAGAYTSGDNLAVKSVGASSNWVSLDSGALSGGAVVLDSMAPTVNTTVNMIVPHVAVTISVGTNFATGNAANTLSVRIWYSIVPAVKFGA